MIEQFNDLLPIVILIFGLITKNESAIIFAAGCCVFSLLVGDWIPAENYNVYYMIAALFDLVIISAISKTNNPDLTIQNLTKSFIYINLLGWFIWMLYIETMTYSYLCFFAYVMIAITTFFGRHHDRIINGSFELDQRDFVFLGYHHQGADLLLDHKTEKKNC